MQSHASRDLAKLLLRYPAVAACRFDVVPLPSEPPPVLPTVVVRVPPLVPVATLELLDGGHEHPRDVLTLGATPQEVMSLLGPPEGFVERRPPRHAVLHRRPAADAGPRSATAPATSPRRGDAVAWPPLPSPLLPAGATGEPPATSPGPGPPSPGGSVASLPGAARPTVAAPPRPPPTVTSDYAFNYFSHGLDVLFDGAAHVAHTWVLHTNVPGHVAFNLYRKCHFRILVAPVGGPGRRMSVASSVATAAAAAAAAVPASPSTAANVAAWSDLEPILDLDDPDAAQSAAPAGVSVPSALAATSSGDVTTAEPAVSGGGSAVVAARSFSDGVADLLGVPELAPPRMHGGPSDAAARSFGPTTDAQAAVIRPETSFETAAMDLGWSACPLLCRC